MHEREGVHRGCHHAGFRKGISALEKHVGLVEDAFAACEVDAVDAAGWGLEEAGEEGVDEAHPDVVSKRDGFFDAIGCVVWNASGKIKDGRSAEDERRDERGKRTYGRD